VSDARPNILLVMADQLTASVLPAYGGPAITPTIDSLAARGVVFDSAYCNTPLCAPSRASLLAGRLPSAIGAYDNGAEFPASVPTIAHHLRARGYETCLAGKMHFIGPDQLHGFEERLTTDVYTAGMDWIPDWTIPVGERLPWYHDMSSVLEAGVSEATLQLDYDEEVGFRSVRKIYDLGRSRERPFFFLVSFTHPHDPYEAPSRYWDRYEDAEVPLPAVPPLRPEELDPHSRRVLEMCGTTDLELTDELVRRARRAYYAAVSYVDDKIAELLAALEATGLRDDTIVVLASDHGDMLGERGLWYKMTFFEDSARVPLIVDAPQRFAPARVAANVSLLDLLPTLVDLAGGGPDAGADGGESLVPLLRADAAERTTPVLGEYLAEGTFAPAVMIREGTLKYVHCPGDPDLLYDLDADPQELVDLAPLPEHAETIRALRARVAATWDLDAIGADVVASQKRRRFVAEALLNGAQAPWDYSPADGSSTRYVRGRNFWEPFGRARLRHD
jgi:choline-sulfatase